MPRIAKPGKKDPDAPKRPPTAFFLYAQTRRDAIKRAHKGAGVTEIARELGKEWRSLSDAKKDKFYAKAEKEKEKYLVKKAKYDEKKSKNGPPKRSPTAFFLFAKDRRPELKRQRPTLSVTDIAKKLGHEWHNMGGKKKRIYQEEAARLKDIYDREKANWESRQLGGGRRKIYVGPRGGNYYLSGGKKVYL